jgi:PilZ domain
MTPPDFAIADAVDSVPFSVRLAARRAMRDRVERTPKPQERRAHPRRGAKELEWLESVRLTGGTGFGVRLIDLSEGGALIEVDAPLRPGIKLILEISGRDIDTTVSLEVLRSYVANLGGAIPLYRGACAFDRLIALPSAAHPQAKAPNPALPTFVGTDASLLYLHARADGMDSRQILHVLDALYMRAAAKGQDAGKEHAEDLLTAIVPPLRRGAPREDVIAALYGALRNVPENDQPRVQETSARLLGLIDHITQTSASEAGDVTPGMESTPFVDPARDTSDGTSTFQKIVVRYADGKIARGFSQNFHPSRPQFSLWPSVNASQSPNSRRSSS